MLTKAMSEGMPPANTMLGVGLKSCAVVPASLEGTGGRSTRIRLGSASRRTARRASSSPFAPLVTAICTGAGSIPGRREGDGDIPLCRAPTDR